MNTAAEHAENLCFAGDTHGGFIFPQFHPGYDAMFAYMRLLEASQKLGCSLSEIYDQIPPFYTLYQAVPCPWELKGRVMRLMTHAINGRIETIDGLKVYTDHSWALVLPDAAEPVIHLFVEARAPQDAERLMQEFTTRIEAIIQGD
jgi:mannose-1-phosphate guanylyltransferase/phosphomannomutase